MQHAEQSSNYLHPGPKARLPFRIEAVAVKVGNLLMIGEGLSRPNPHCGQATINQRPGTFWLVSVTGYVVLLSAAPHTSHGGSCISVVVALIRSKLMFGPLWK